MAAKKRAAGKRPQRKRLIRFVAFNITTHPNLPGGDNYTTLFKRAAELRTTEKMFRERKARIGLVTANEAGEVRGRLMTWNELAGVPWVDIDTGETIDAKTISEEMPIPPSRRPHPRRAEFVFFPEQHRLFVDSREFTVASLQTVFSKILNDPEVKQSASRVTVTAEQDAGQLERILEIPVLKRITVVVSLPNGDDLGDMAEGLIKELEDQNANTMSLTLEADEGGSLALSQRTKALSRVALSNGYVEARGKTQKGKNVKISTEDAPEEFRERYDPTAEAETEAFVRAARGRIPHILSKLLP